MDTAGRVLVTGAAGQIGSELVPALRERYGPDSVVASDIREDVPRALAGAGPWLRLDVLDRAGIEAALRKNGVRTVFHMAAILSATGERNPLLCWDVNMNGTLNLLEACRASGVERVIVPSSIAVFGPETPREGTPQETVLRPRTMYGITKVAGELISDYYSRSMDLDVRGLRYPGIVSAETLPGGGTTDYAVEIYYKAVELGRYTCFVSPGTMLPMMYMPDCVRATIMLAEADPGRLRHRGDFNVGALSFTAGELAASISAHVPGFEVTYEPDFRQAIADTWPSSVDDSAAREEWGWEPEWDLEAMTADMLDRLRKRHAAGALYSSV